MVVPHPEQPNPVGFTTILVIKWREALVLLGEIKPPFPPSCSCRYADFVADGLAIYTTTVYSIGLEYVHLCIE